LNGYEDYNKVPDYRNVPSAVRAKLIQHNSIRNNIELPFEVLDSEMRNFVSTFNIYISVSEIEFIAKEKKGFNITLPLNVRKAFEPKVMNYEIENVWRFVPINSVITVLSKIKNHLLSFLLELNEEIGGDKELSIMSKKNKVDEIFKNTMQSLKTMKTIIRMKN